MNPIYDYKRFAVLYVDDEEKSLKYFTRAFADTFRIFTATNARDGYKILEENQETIGVIMTDQRMPGEQGVQFLERARRLRPQVIRILATAFADLDAAIHAVNSGAIYKYITKPWDVPALETTLKRSLEFFMVQAERDQLLREKLSVLHRLLITDRVLSLGVLASGLGQHVRNALDAVGTFLELAPSVARPEVGSLDRLGDPEFWQDLHRRVHDRLKMVAGLLDDLSDQGAMPFRFDQEVSVAAAIQDALVSLAAEFAARRIEISNNIGSDLPALRVDPARFRKLFSLLLRHELATLVDGTSIRFEATHRAASETRGEEIDVTVSDTGTGIAGQAILSLFDPLLVAKGPGTDSEMYLMAVYFIVYHHGGRVKVNSRPGSGGLSITLTFPTQPKTTDVREDTRDFLVRAMTNERLWDRLLAGM